MLQCFRATFAQNIDFLTKQTMSLYSFNSLSGIQNIIISPLVITEELPVYGLDWGQ